MLALKVFLLALSLYIDSAYPSSIQVPLDLHKHKPRTLHGRFLHITDIHPDPYYTPGTSQSKACHRKRPKKKSDKAGYYGTPYSECDAPFRLTNYTLDFIEENWASEIDFVIWTGDNARHDNDRKIPRTPSEIYTLNRSVAERMERIFLHRGIPVIPSLGNNDVWPHNILTPGPNSITNEYASIWSHFIPFPYLQVFQRGAYYTVEVVPDELAVISLNTMYFYDSNKVVSGCVYTARDDPGNLQLDWLEVQLKMYRERGIQVWLSGHVPPSPGNYFSECYVRYAELALRFQDTILGHLYGHMNADHFFFLEAVDLVPKTKFKFTKGVGLYETLLNDFSSLPKSSNIVMDEYAAVNVAPSVVPNPYLPSFRIFTYNISKNAQHELQGALKKKKRKHGHDRGDKGNKTTHCQIEEHQKTWICHLNDPWHSDPDSPSRSNQRWTPLGFAQYYLPSIKDADKSHPPHFELEYVTYSVANLHPRKGLEDDFQYPIPLKHLPTPLQNATTSKSKYAPYGLADLTIGSWVRLARRLGDSSHGKLRKRFRKYMFGGGKEGE